jgi:hypothetical protein
VFIETGKLFPYNGSYDVYRCPVDAKVPDGIRAALRGQRRVRSYTMHGRMGGADDLDASKYGVSSTSWVLGTGYPMFKKMTDINAPDAGSCFEESYPTVDDGYRCEGARQHDPAEFTLGPPRHLL